MPHTSETAAAAIAKSRTASESGTSGARSQREFPILPPQPDYAGPEILSPAMKSLLGRARAVLVEEEDDKNEIYEERKLEFTIKGNNTVFSEPPLTSISMFSDPVRSFSPPPPPSSSSFYEHQTSSTAAVIPSYTLSAARLQPINALADRALAAASEAVSSSSLSSSSPRHVNRQNVMNVPPPVLLTSPMPSIDPREAAERPHLVFSTSLPSSSSSSSSPPPQPQSLSSLPSQSMSAFSAHTQGSTSSSFSSSYHRVLSVHLPASTPQQTPSFGIERPFRPSRSTNASSSSSPQNASSFSNAHVVIDGGASASASLIASRAAATPFSEPINTFSSSSLSSLSSATPGLFSSALQDILSPLRR